MFATGRVGFSAYTNTIDESEHPALRESTCSDVSTQCDGCSAPFAPIVSDYAGYAGFDDHSVRSVRRSRILVVLIA